MADVVVSTSPIEKAFGVTAELRSGVRPRPNKSLQPTATAVTPPAAQEIVPAVAVAEH
jgi:hypothetical protein